MLPSPTRAADAVLRESPSDVPGSEPPLVTILITAYNRADELRQTLRALRTQTYPALELFVIDDCSTESLEPVIRAEAPESRFWRNATNRGLVASRSFGMARARGAYIVTLDDDSHLVAPDAVARAVERMERETDLAVLTFLLHEGVKPPSPDLTPGTERYTHTFLGGANVMRTRAVREVGGYRDFFEYYMEESEYALRLIDRGWRILHLPELVVHHRISPVGRSAARIAAYSLRNSVWTVLLTMPLAAVALEVPWKLVVGCSEVIRRGNPWWAVWAFASTARGLPRVVRERTPITRAATRTYQTLRFRDVRTPEALRDGRPPGMAERWRWFRTVWMRRRRPRAFWDTRPGHLGTATWTTRASAD